MSLLYHFLSLRDSWDITAGECLFFFLAMACCRVLKTLSFTSSPIPSVCGQLGFYWHTSLGHCTSQIFGPGPSPPLVTHTVLGSKRFLQFRAWVGFEFSSSSRYPAWVQQLWTSCHDPGLNHVLIPWCQILSHKMPFFNFWLALAKTCLARAPVDGTSPRLKS